MPRARVWRALPVGYVMPKARLVTAARVRQFHAEGMKVLTWTVNQASAMQRLREAGVEGSSATIRRCWRKVSRFQGFKVSQVEGQR